ncbi:MAG TPA: hypothetical protein PK728_07625 [Bacillota bacterium]|nr:hypothetical protein [Bacillota bacterium]
MRSAAIIIKPELDIWVWGKSQHIERELGWSSNYLDLRTWLKENGYINHEFSKPDWPKRVLEVVLKKTRKPRSSSIYKNLAEAVSLGHCADPAFVKLKTVLRGWFPAVSK